MKTRITVSLSPEVKAQCLRAAEADDRDLSRWAARCLAAASEAYASHSKTATEALPVICSRLTAAEIAAKSDPPPPAPFAYPTDWCTMSVADRLTYLEKVGREDINPLA